MYYYVLTYEQHVEFMIDFISELQNVHFFHIRIHGEKVFNWCLDHRTITISPFLHANFLNHVEGFLHYFVSQGYESVYIDVDYLPIEHEEDVDHGYGSG